MEIRCSRISGGINEKSFGSINFDEVIINKCFAETVCSLIIRNAAEHAVRWLGLVLIKDLVKGVC